MEADKAVEAFTEVKTKSSKLDSYHYPPWRGNSMGLGFLLVGEIDAEKKLGVGYILDNKFRDKNDKERGV